MLSDDLEWSELLREGEVEGEGEGEGESEGEGEGEGEYRIAERGGGMPLEVEVKGSVGLNSRVRRGVSGFTLG